MNLKYLICVKFGTTCWNAHRSFLNDFEIIEFPALLLNIETGLVDSVFHRYVRPTYFSKLSEYCQKSTGITQTFIDTQQQFADVFTDFIQWMGDIMMKYDLIFATPFNLNSPKWYNVTFCSWTDWDLGHFLYRDCIRNKIDRFDGLKAWIDIRRSYKDFAVQHGREITSYEAFLHANIVTSQKQSNALEWANDLAKLVAKLASNGHLSTDIRLSSY